MGRISRGKKALAAVLFLWVVLANCLAGCTRNDATEKLRDIGVYSGGGAGRCRRSLRDIIGEKQAAPFKLTYSDGQGLYIVQGYGEQETGGYSIAVRQLYLTEDSIVFDAELIGPEKGEDGGTEKSYPYIVVKTELLENPVVFQ